MFANNRDFGKLFKVQQKRVLSFVSRTTQTCLGAVSAAANVNKHRYAYAYRATYP